MDSKSFIIIWDAVKPYISKKEQAAAAEQVASLLVDMDLLEDDLEEIAGSCSLLTPILAEYLEDEDEMDELDEY